MCPTVDNFLPVSQAHWNTAYYGTMAVASATTDAFQRKAAEIAFPLRLWNVARQMRNLVDIIEHPEKARATPESEPVDMNRLIQQIDNLVNTVDDVYERCRRAGFTNRTLTASQLSAIYRYNDAIRDFNERAKLILDPKTEAMFEEACQEYLRGESVGLEAIL